MNVVDGVSFLEAENTTLSPTHLFLATDYPLCAFDVQGILKCLNNSHFPAGGKAVDEQCYWNLTPFFPNPNS